jgi:hypothetical protein
MGDFSTTANYSAHIKIGLSKTSRPGKFCREQQAGAGAMG